MRRTHESGFTLIEILVSMAVIAILASSMIPLATATIRGERIDEVRSELSVLADAASEFYYQNGSFPTSLTQVGFYGVYFLPGVQDEAITDAWGTGNYRLSATSSPDALTIYSVGEDAVDQGAASEAYKATVSGSTPGSQRTRLRMRVIVAAVAEYVGGGGTITGTWSSDHTNLGLASEYRTDGFGTDFALQAGTLQLRSAGPDRNLNTADDIVF